VAGVRDYGARRGVVDTYTIYLDPNNF
jgi:hypothetical protein